MGSRATWIADRRSTNELFADALGDAQLPEDQTDRSSGAFDVLLWRSGPEVLSGAIELTRSAAAHERVLGIDLLARIHAEAFRVADEREAWATHALRNGYLDDTLPVLRALTATERDREVLAALASAFGQREDPRGIAPLAYLAEHEDARVRENAARALPPCVMHPDRGASAGELARALADSHRIAAPLLVLADDPDGDVRDWALFGLHLIELDTPEIRDVFLAHVDDPHHDAATEALYGLANLGDVRGIAPLRRRIEGGDDARILIEACVLHGDAQLVPALQALRDDEFTADDDELDAALAACRANAGWRGPSLGLWSPT